MKGIHKMFGLGKTDAVTEASAILDELTRLSAGITAELEGIGGLNREKAGAESQLADVIGAESGGESAARERVEGCRLALQKAHEDLTIQRRRYLKLVAQLPALHQDLSDSLPKREAEMVQGIEREWKVAAQALAEVSARRRAIERALGRRLSLVVAEVGEPSLNEVAPAHDTMRRIRMLVGSLENDGVLAAKFTAECPPPTEALTTVQTVKRTLQNWDWARDCERRGQRA